MSYVFLIVCLQFCEPGPSILFSHLSFTPSVLQGRVRIFRIRPWNSFLCHRCTAIFIPFVEDHHDGTSFITPNAIVLLSYHPCDVVRTYNCNRVSLGQNSACLSRREDKVQGAWYYY